MVTSFIHLFPNRPYVRTNQNARKIHRIYHDLNTFTPNTDQHLISPHKITPESHIDVMRITEIILN